MRNYIVNVKMNDNKEFVADRLTSIFSIDNINDACNYVKQLDKWGFKEYTLTTFDKCKLFNLNGFEIDLLFLTACLREKYSIDKKDTVYLLELLSGLESRDEIFNSMYDDELLSILYILNDIYGVDIEYDINNQLVVIRR